MTKPCLNNALILKPMIRWLCLLLVPAAGLVTAGCARQELIVARTGWLGLDTSLGHSDYDEGWVSAKPTAQDRQIYFDLMGELGVPMMRDLAMSWARVQPAAGGDYDYSLSDDLVRRAGTARIDLLAVCWGIPRWAATFAEGRSVDLGVPGRQHADEFGAFVRRFVERYDGDGSGDMPDLQMPLRAYEFMNEPEGVPPAEYAFWLKLFHESVKAADPKALVVLGSLKSPGLRIADEPEGDYPTYFERLLAAPELAGPRFPYFDVVGFHNFPADYPGRGEFDEALAYVRRTMDAHRLNLPIWLTAYGYNSGTDQEQRQAENIVKWALRARVRGVERVYLHSLRDYHWPGESGPGQRVGLVGEVRSGQVPPRKPAFEVFSMLLRELEQHPNLSARGETFYVLMGTESTVYCVWKQYGIDPAPLLMTDWWEVRTITGRKSVVQGTDLQLDESPRFLQRTPSPVLGPVKRENPVKRLLR